MTRSLMHLHVAFFSGLLVLLASCSSTHYVANAPNTSMLSEVGEISANASIGSVNATQTINFQGAFSPAKHLGVQLNAGLFTARNRDFSEVTIDDSYGLNGRLFEGGIGYYDSLGEYGFKYDIYGGFGHFNGNTEVSILGQADFKYNRIYVQPSIGFASEFVDLNFCLRGVLLDINEVRYEFPTANGPNANFSLPIPDTKSHVLLEPALTARLGYKYVKLQAQFGTVLNLSGYYLDYDPMFLSVGLVFNFKPSYTRNKNGGIFENLF